jgi:hypothetical protein
MTLAWSKAVITEDDVVAVLVQYQVDLSSVLAKRNETRTLLTDIASILRVESLTLQVRQLRARGKQHRKYYIASL